MHVRDGREKYVPLNIYCPNSMTELRRYNLFSEYHCSGTGDLSLFAALWTALSMRRGVAVTRTVSPNRARRVNMPLAWGCNCEVAVKLP